MDFVLVGPQISACTNSSGVFALQVVFGNGKRCILPYMHPSQTLSSQLIWGRPTTIFLCFNSLRPLKFRCPYRRCHRKDSSMLWLFIANSSFLDIVRGNILLEVIGIFATFELLDLLIILHSPLSNNSL